MAIKRYICDADTSITNAFKADLLTRGTGSNSGESDVLQIFSIYAQQDSGSSELSRALLHFPIDNIISDRTNGLIPASGSCDFYLKMFNAEHPFTTPRKFTLQIQALTQSFDEGQGIDIDNFSDSGICNWIQASSNSSGINSWATAGGDFWTDAYVPGTNLPEYYTAYFENGTEHLETKITSLVEEWIASNGSTNNGIGVFLTSSTETALSSSYTKKFFARGSEFFHKRPYIETRWKDAIQDDRVNFYASSSLADATDNLNTIYLYNKIRGRFKNIPDVGTGNIYIQIYTDDVSGSILTEPPITGGHHSTGIYSASFALDTTESVVYDRWFNSGLTTCYHTGTIIVKDLLGSNINPDDRYVISITNLRDTYSTTENPRLRVFTRKKNWCPTIYTKAIRQVELDIPDDVYYKINRVSDDLEVIGYLTGSNSASLLSRDISGSYFNLDMSLFEPDYAYQIRFIRRTNTQPDRYEEFSDSFKFRVEK